MTWKRLSFVLAALCIVLWWRRPAPEVVHDTPECAKPAIIHTTSTITQPEPAHAELYGFAVPSWALSLAPQPGEDLRSYRDRMLPLAQAAVAPQRARVARSRDAMAQLIGLDDHQRAELDAAAREAANQIEERVLGAVMNGDFSPQTFKPMTGVDAARDVLDIVSKANQRFVASLRNDQRAKLAGHPFDFADYLVFSTRWEDVLQMFD